MFSIYVDMATFVMSGRCDMWTLLGAAKVVMCTVQRLFTFSTNGFAEFPDDYIPT